MRKFENVDVIAALGAVMESNTAHYKSDYQYDVEMFQKAAAAPDSDINRLLWLSRPSGTECFYERDAYLTGNYANHAWGYYADTKDNILAYAVEITSKEGGKVMGTLYELDYKAHVQRLEKDALPAASVTVKYEDGAERNFPYEDWNKRKREVVQAEVDHGKPVRTRFDPQNEDFLQRRLRQERAERQKYTPAVFKLRSSSRKPSIRAQLAEGKAAAAPKKAAAKEKTKNTEVSL